MERFRKLAGLPPYGAPAIGFPRDWGARGREGFVVEFRADDGTWVGNFQTARDGAGDVRPHPNGRDVLVLAGDVLWHVDVSARDARLLSKAVEEYWSIDGDLVCSRRGLAFFRIASEGMVWHTRRVSWDGFQNIRIAGDILSGEAWSPIQDRWTPFRLDLRSGRVEGGSYDGSPMEGWELTRGSAGSHGAG